MSAEHTVDSTSQEPQESEQATKKSQPSPTVKRKKHRRWPWITLGVLVVIIVAGALFLNIYTNSGKPVTKGTLAVKGLQSKVTVVRDKDGTPHITAANLHDLYMAQGYVEAQERMFQMDLSRRQSEGKLSEVFGSMAVDSDKTFRTYGLQRAAEASLPGYPQDTVDKLQAFSDGVNAYIAQAKTSGFSPEFKLLGYTPEPWTPIDTLTIGKYMAYDLGGHWNAQAFRQYIFDHFPKAQAEELVQQWPGSGAPTILASEDMTITAKPTANIAQQLASAAQFSPNPFNGSNDWVVSGTKTTTGLPLLCDDPHLEVATPSVWYQMELQAPGMHVSGTIFGGVPGIILGQNEDCAWGVTNTGPDVQDLYIEKQNPKDPHEYLYEGQWYKAKTISEPIKVKGAATIDFQVDETRHGPVISQLASTDTTSTSSTSNGTNANTTTDPTQAATSADNTVYSLRWTALAPTTELEAVFDFNAAKNWSQFEQALRKFQAPAQNFVFACKDGTIAYRANGLIPIRKGDGFLPVPGWDSSYEWKGYIPWDDLPQTVNPPKGFVATANNKVTPDNYPYHVSWNWSQPYRSERITQLLSAKDKLSVADMEAIQADYLDLHAKEFSPEFVKALKGADLTNDEKQALSILNSWDFKASKDSGAPLIFNRWYEQAQKDLFNDKLSPDVLALFEDEDFVTDQLLRTAVAGKPGAWIENSGGLQSLLDRSLKETLTTIKKEQGDDLSKWTWGAWHQVAFTNPLSSKAILKPLFNPRSPDPDNGSRTTIRAAGWDDTGSTDLASTWRFIADLSDLSSTQQLCAPGESGHPRSKFYNNQVDDWLNGRHHITQMGAVSGDTLTLKP
ncbi:MAG: penicillin acylase family protein [Coriobacteriia bacterium]|nr:penicillin acylase family protein [Coriobacteriia bacterium]